jgi:hypothetical protein
VCTKSDARSRKKKALIVKRVITVPARLDVNNIFFSSFLAFREKQN